MSLTKKYGLLQLQHKKKIEVMNNAYKTIKK